MVFPVVMVQMWELYHKKVWALRIDAFELWCCRRLLRVPWTARRSNQSILKEINPEYSLEWLMLKLKPQYFGHLMWRANSLEKTLMLGKIEGRRRTGQQKMRWSTNGHEFEQTPRDSEGQGKLVCCSPWAHKESDTTEWLNNNNNNNPCFTYCLWICHCPNSSLCIHLSSKSLLIWQHTVTLQTHIT